MNDQVPALLQPADTESPVLPTLIRVRNELVARGEMPASSVDAFDRTIRKLQKKHLARELAPRTAGESAAQPAPEAE